MRKRTERRKKGLVIDRRDSSIRGSFINLFITMAFMVLIMIGAFVREVRENLVAMSPLIVPFYAISFGVWRAGRYFDAKLKGGCEDEMVDNWGSDSPSIDDRDVSIRSEESVRSYSP